MVTDRISHNADSGSARAISVQLNENLEEIQSIFTLTPDLNIRTFDSRFVEGRVALVY
jgi:spore germination protein